MDDLLIEGQKVQRDGGRLHRPEARLESLPLFRTVRGWVGDWDDSGTLLIAEVPLKLEWDVFFAITVEWFWIKTWHVELHAVAPEAPDRAVLDAALHLINVNPAELAEKDRNQAKIEALVGYGVTATLSDFYSENARSAVLAAMAEAIGATTNFNLYMDCPVNALGATGWDFMRGFTTPPEKNTNAVPNTRPAKYP